MSLRTTPETKGTDQARGFFDERHATYSRLARWATNQELLNASRQMLSSSRPRVVADLGGGNGLLLAALPGLDAELRIALDLSVSMLRATGDATVSRVVGNIHSLPLASGTVDLVLCRQVLQYCQTAPALSEVARVLRLGGRAHIVQLTDHEDVDGGWVAYWVGLRRVEARHRISSRELVEAIRSVRLEIDDVSNVSMRVEHSWESFCEKNRVALDRKLEVIDYFRTAPQATAAWYDFGITEAGISYNRRFTLVNARKRHEALPTQS